MTYVIQPTPKALHSLVVTVERALHIKEYAPAISLSIRNLLSCRRVHSECGTASLVRGAHRGTPQGAVLSRLLWNLVADDLIKRFERRAPNADAIGIIITGVCPSTFSSRLESTLREVYEWAEKVGLSINADKTDLILFTKRYKVPKWTPENWRNLVEPENTGQIPRHPM